jgi:hypothetical protein
MLLEVKARLAETSQSKGSTREWEDFREGKPSIVVGRVPGIVLKLNVQNATEVRTAQLRQLNFEADRRVNAGNGRTMILRLFGEGEMHLSGGGPCWSVERALSGLKFAAVVRKQLKQMKRTLFRLNAS